MKRILLASTAIVGFAGAAAADGHAADGISFSGDASLEWNSETDFDWGADININMTSTLDNGLTVAVDWEIDFTDDNLGNDLSASDFVLSLTSDTAGLYFGDTGMAADGKWSAVGDMEADDFSATDGETVLRGEMSFGDVDAAVSYIVDDTILVADDPLTPGVNEEVRDENTGLEQLSIGVAADLGSVSVTFGYQEEGPAAIAGQGDDYDADEVVAISASTTFGGADVSFGYASNQTESEDSLGFEVSYPVSDAVTVGFYYVAESAGDDNAGVSLDYTAGPLSASVYYRQEQEDDDYGVDVDYDLGNGVALFAGFAGGDGSDDGYYLGGAMDLGNGAEVRLIYVDVDEINGDNEYFGDDDEDGTTLSLSFSF